jgi:tetratricopeptide (TPR) repeat protein
MLWPKVDPSADYSVMINRLLIIVVMALLLLSGCKSSEDYFSEGLDQSSDGNFKAALLVFNRAIELNPFFKDAYIQKGVCHENLNQPDSAIDVYMRLLHLYPDNTAANYYAGICKYRQKKYEEAIAFYDKALDTKGGFNISDTSSFQALIDLKKDDFESESAEMDIPTREILYDRAMAYFKSGQVKKASTDFANCIFQQYNPGTSYYMIGLCHLAKKQKRNARQAFLQASQFGDSLAMRQLKFM